MPYTMHPTPRLSSSPSSRAQSIVSPRESTSAARPQVTSHNSAVTGFMKKLNGATEEYWNSPSPLYTPRASVSSRPASVSAPVASAAASSSSKKEKKAGVVNKVKRAINRNTEDYWGNAEMNTYYAAGLKI